MSKKFIITSSISAALLLIAFLIITIVLAVNDFLPLNVDSSVAQWAYDVRGEKVVQLIGFLELLLNLDIHILLLP